jgi:hypothetical protein
MKRLMKTWITVTTLGLAFLPLLAEPPVTGAMPPAADKAAQTIKQRLLDSLGADLKRIDEADDRQRHAINLLMQGVEVFDPATAGEYELPKLARHAASPTVSQDSRKLYLEYEMAMRTLMRDHAVRLQEDFNARCRDFILRAAATSETRDIEAIKSDLTAYGTGLTRQPTRARDIPGSHLGNIGNFLDTWVRMIAAREAGEWDGMGRNLQQLEQGYAKIRHFLGNQEADDVLSKIRSAAGALTLEELKSEFDAALDALFDDAKQDDLEQLTEKIQKLRMLYGSGSSPEFSSMANRLRHLASLAEAFTRAVRDAREGRVPQFIPEQWARANPDSMQLIKPSEMIRRLKDYKVRVGGGADDDSSIRMYYDAREIMARISSLEDVAREIADLRRAMRFLSYSGDPGSSSMSLPVLQYYADSYDHLSGGDAFVMPVNPMRQRDPLGQRVLPDDSTSALLARLDEELMWQLLRRFSDDPPPDDTGSPWSWIEEQLRIAAGEGDFKTVLTIHQIAGHFADPASLLAPYEMDAIRQYLAGRHQEEVMIQPRLATLYYQKAAASGSDILPMEEIKERLHRLRSDHRADYDKGTDDSLLATAGANFPAPGPLRVPARK